VVRSDYKIDEDWERKLKERERRKLERERNGDKKEKCMHVQFLFFFKV